MADHDSIRDQLVQCYTGVVHDVMRADGHRNFTLPPDMTPLIPDQVLCGPAFTISGHIDESADPHETLLAWTGLLSKARSGHIWAAQPNDNTIAHMGELSAETLAKRGIRGCVIDGGIRDTRFLVDIGFQAWRRFHTPRDIVGMWLPDAVDVEIVIGDVAIQPGDYLLGDLDGMVRIPKDKAADIAARASEAMQTENKVRTAILEGTDPQEAYLQYGKF
ncbi:MAG: RraA family protein [Hyphomicrobiales bacterium]|nr:RraA family protein [Hyphomicrobiales bacterium]